MPDDLPPTPPEPPPPVATPPEPEITLEEWIAATQSCCGADNWEDDESRLPDLER